MCQEVSIPTKTRITQRMVYPVAPYGSESWTLKRDQRNIDTFEHWCWRRLLRLLWIDSKAPNKRIIEEINAKFPLEASMTQIYDILDISCEDIAL